MRNESPEYSAPEVRCERLLPVERRAVWLALCDAHGLEQWLADEVDIEIREGARGILRWAGGDEREALVEEVLEQRRLALRWWEPGGEPSLVELTLDDAPGGTRLVVVEVPLQTLRAVAHDLLPEAFGGPTQTGGAGPAARCLVGIS